jgi:hypothetical protein
MLFKPKKKGFTYVTDIIIVIATGGGTAKSGRGKPPAHEQFLKKLYGFDPFAPYIGLKSYFLHHSI